MGRRRKNITKLIETSSESEEESPKKKQKPTPEKKISTENENSSSESDIENYLQRPDKLDLNSTFFSLTKPNEKESEFNQLEKNMFDGITTLSDSDSNEDFEQQTEKTEVETKTIITEPEPSTSTKMNFDTLQDYTKKIDEARKHVELYKAKKLAKENKDDILNLLAMGETKTGLETSITVADLHSSDFESCDSEQEDWEEIKSNTVEPKEKSIVPKTGLQITVDMPETVRKKKGVDIVAAMKRRLNRIRKENQVLVHKVHLLCWVAHGNYVNSTINNPSVLAMALSLLPSEQCYPPDRTDLSYLEQIVTWYKRTVKNLEKLAPKTPTLEKILQDQISKKEAYNKKMLVYIFIAILRSLGIQCRLVLSLQVEPVRPPAGELHSLSTKEEKETSKNKKLVKSKKNIELSTKEMNSSVKEEKKIDLSKLKTTKCSLENRGKVKIDPIKKELKVSLEKLEDKKQKSPMSKSTKRRTEDKQRDSETKSKTSEHKSTINDALGVSSGKRRTKSPNQKPICNTKTSTEETIGKKSNSEVKSTKDDGLEIPTGRRRTKSPNQKPICNSKTSKEEAVSKNVQVQSDRSPNGRSEVKLPKNKALKVSTSKKRTESSNQKPNIETDTNSNEAASGDAKNTSSSKTKEPKDIIKVKLPKIPKKTNLEHNDKQLPQVDGANDSSSDEESEPILQLDGANDQNKTNSKSKPNLSKLKSPINTQCKIKDHPKRLVNNNAHDDSDSEFEPKSPKKGTNKPNLNKLKDVTTTKQMDVTSDIMNLIKGRIREQKVIDRNKKVAKRKSYIDSDSDSDFAPEPIKKKHQDDEHVLASKTKVKRRVQIPVNSNENENTKKKGIDVWIEVFLESEEKWISVDVIHGQVHCIKELYQRATHPVSYIVAWNNNNTLKDITKRYCQNFNTVTRKLRTDHKWWEETLRPFIGPRTARDKEEDDDLARQQLDQPLPKSIAEYKNHPLYALRRHLLKFEAIYPPDAATLGFVRNEPVYSRDCVYVLHSRDIWLKSAKVVKLGEKPYKIVKARPKYDKLSNTMITDQLLEIFGPWQVEDYVPPTAENGVVPRNAFGNVELFKSCMLPKGTVHLKLPGLNKLARKMNIDCASAIVGFDFHGGWSHPTYDGFVVCEEFEDQLIAAWEIEQDEIEKREQEKIDKRVYTNWKRLIKGLLIRERLKAKYDFGEPSKENTGKNKQKKGVKFCTKK